MDSAGALTPTSIPVELMHTSLSDAQRLRHLFDSAPVALFEEDFTEVVLRLVQLAEDGCDDLEALFDEDPSALFDLIMRIRIVDANPAAVRMLGVESADQLRGPFQAATVNDESFKAFRGQVLALWRGETSWSSTFEGSDVYGRVIPVRLSLHVPIADGTPDLAHVVVSMTDVSEMMAARRDLERLIRWKDEFTASVAHELRTPVTGIIGLSQMLAGDNELSTAEVAELTSLLAAEANELERLVEDLLVAGRSAAGQLDIRTEPIDVCAAVSDVVKLIDPATTVQGGSIMAIGDGVRVRQIVRNLVTNALRYGGPKRRVKVQVIDGTAVIDVQDNGGAISVVDQARMFEAFGRGGDKTVDASVGLGLAVSRTLARAQAGDLEYRRYGDWNTFRLSLPVG